MFKFRDWQAIQQTHNHIVTIRECHSTVLYRDLRVPYNIRDSVGVTTSEQAHQPSF